MRCIPPEPDFNEGQLAEKAVWDVLKAELPDDAVMAHSVQVRHGRAEHEIDILVLWPGVGLAAIEVKGGLVTNEHGQWFQSGGKDGKRQIQDPTAQSQGSMQALRDWLNDNMGTKLTSRFVYMAAFPYSAVPQDWVRSGNPRAIILDQDDCKSPAEKIRHAIEVEGGGTVALAPSYLERIIPRIEGNLEQTETSAAGYEEDEDKQEHLIERQAVLLTATRSLPRIRFTGGAGRGKTWLAVEKARELCKSGKKVGLFCYNKGLGMYLANQVAGWRSAKPAFTGKFHEYVLSLGVPVGIGQDYYRRWDSAAAIQDLILIHIDDNLRNTKKIAETFKSFAGDRFTPRGSTGMAVRRVECSEADALNVASDCVDALINDGWANNQIALLTTKSQHPIHLDYVDKDTIGEYWREFHAKEGEFYGHVLGFKGLERSVVILCVNGFKDMSRAAETSWIWRCPGRRSGIPQQIDCQQR